MISLNHIRWYRKSKEYLSKSSHANEVFCLRQKVLIILLTAILLIRMIPHLGEWYAQHVYPVVSYILSAISSTIPFSLEEWIVIGVATAMLYYPFHARHNRKTWKCIIAHEAETICWVIVWFYVGWGANYQRDSYYLRTGITDIEIEDAEFDVFLRNYTDSLNSCYVSMSSVDKDNIVKEIKKQYALIPECYGLAKPQSFQHPKRVSFNWLYSSVGVLGYMGPFADESQLNNQLFPSQYAFTYAHELAHLLSVSNEAEANYWAFVTCTRSHDKAVRYSGYYGILMNVVRNAKANLPEEEYKRWVSSIDRRIIAEKESQLDFWKSQYSPVIADIQDVMFNALLKGNNIPDGTKNYDSVMRMIILSK